MVSSASAFIHTVIWLTLIDAAIFCVWLDPCQAIHFAAICSEGRLESFVLKDDKMVYIKAEKEREEAGVSWKSKELLG